MNTKIQLIAMDMDGTLLNSSKQISQGNLQALREAATKGIHLAICSGRLPGDAGQYALNAALNDCAILAMNGSYCLESPTGEVFAAHWMDADCARACVQLMEEYGMVYGAFAKNEVAIMHQPENVGDDIWGLQDETAIKPSFVHGQQALERVLKTGVNKFLCYHDDVHVVDALAKELETIPELDVTSSWPLCLELMPKGIGKGLAVSELAARLGLDASQVMAIGDYDNDLSMIEWAGYGVAMANASEAVRKAARFHTLSNDQDGVAKAIRRYAL